MLFSNTDFNFPHFEIEESFGLIWVKLTKWSISLANLQVLVLSMDLIFAHCVYKESFGKISVKITE